MALTQEKLEVLTVIISRLIGESQWADHELIAVVRIHIPACNHLLGLVQGVVGDSSGSPWTHIIGSWICLRVWRSFLTPFLLDWWGCTIPKVHTLFSPFLMDPIGGRRAFSERWVDQSLQFLLGLMNQPPSMYLFPRKFYLHDPMIFCPTFANLGLVKFLFYLLLNSDSCMPLVIDDFQHVLRQMWVRMILYFVLAHDSMWALNIQFLPHSPSTHYYLYVLSIQEHYDHLNSSNSNHSFIL